MAMNPARLAKLESGDLRGIPGTEGLATLMTWIYGLIFTVGATTGVATLLRSAPLPIARTVVGVVVILLISGCFFLLRKRRLITYAIVEILFAIGAAAETMRYELSDIIKGYQSFKLVAAAYLLVRGFDNLDKGLQKRKEDLAAKTASNTP